LERGHLVRRIEADEDMGHAVVVDLHGELRAFDTERDEQLALGGVGLHRRERLVHLAEH
jgi:hypothetical protein